MMGAHCPVASGLPTAAERREQKLSKVRAGLGIRQSIQFLLMHHPKEYA